MNDFVFPGLPARALSVGFYGENLSGGRRRNYVPASSDEPPTPPPPPKLPPPYHPTLNSMPYNL